MSKEADNMQNDVLVEHSVQCSNCDNSKADYNSEIYYFTEDLIRDGWRKPGYNIYCPDCAKKKLKSKK